MKKINIAIDGPAGAGKSTIARRAAEKLGFIYVDTGALYRTLTYFILEKGLEPDNSVCVASAVKEVSVELKFSDGVQRVYLNGNDVSDKIRTPEISMGASKISAIPEIRELLLDLQRKIAAENNVIMDGRDIGTVVLPDAELKIFLTASAEERAKRRCLELEEKGNPQSYDKILADIIQRDYNDSHRRISPLKQAEDAVLLDTTDMNIDEVCMSIFKLAEGLRG